MEKILSVQLIFMQVAHFNGEAISPVSLNTTFFLGGGLISGILML
jgi:hypothetical protein